MEATDLSRQPGPDDGRETELLNYIYSLLNFDELRNSPTNLLAAISMYSTECKRLIHIGPRKGAQIADKIAERKPYVMFELGGYVGYSAILFGDAVRRAGGQRYISLEINPIHAAVAKLLIELAGLEDFISIIIAPAHLSLAQLVHDNLLDAAFT
ncbi:O-methyltransferase [Penicillium argentinense]|uniref:catechol O-methyltransferase n=1 Tax=Penicillium argentinense TaxID=1131581 RepID=A0A9W9FNN6_9EURO|nr:O-methyltransferase [Penicillium argentinense]KAJ5103474.1 O-methyltransferase [Penicillium argentinense]